MNKVIYVPSYFLPVGENVKKKMPTGEKKKGLFGGEKDVTETVIEWEQTGYSDSFIDGEKLTQDIAKAVDQLNSDGYEVVSVTPVTSGKYDHSHLVNSSRGYAYGYGYGYSFTSGVTIVGRKVT